MPHGDRLAADAAEGELALLQDFKTQPGGRVFAEADILTCQGIKGMGNTSAAIRAADPEDRDLEALRAHLAIDRLKRQLPRVLTCLWLCMLPGELPSKAAGSMQLRSAAVAE